MGPASPTFRSDRRLIVVLLILTPLAHLVAYKIFYQNVGLDLQSPGGHIGGDFLVFWAAAKMIAVAPAADLYELAKFRDFVSQLLGRDWGFHPWPYPPGFVFIVAPFALMPYAWSYLAWLAATFAAYLWAVLGREWLHIRGLALLLAPATLVNVTVGQNGFLTAALFVGGFRMMHRWPILAGVLLGLLTFKPQLGLLIPVALVAARRWTVFVSAALTTIALIAVSSLYFGVETWRAYLAFLPEFATVTRDVTTGLFAYAMPTPFMSARILGLDVTAAYQVQAVFSAAAVALVYLVFRKTDDLPLQLATIFTAVFLATPFAFAYDMTLLTVAVLLLLHRALARGFHAGERVILLLAWLAPIVTLAGNFVGVPVAPAVTAALLGALIIRVQPWKRSTGRPAATASGTAESAL